MEQSTRIIKDNLPDWIGEAKNIIHLDFHTGLGSKGECTMMLFDNEEKEYSNWAETKFPSANRIEPWGGKTGYEARGTIGSYFLKKFSKEMRDYRPITAEFGTVKDKKVMEALIEENRAHFHPHPKIPINEKSKDRLLEAFCPDDEDSWRKPVVDKGIKLINQGVSACFSQT